MATKKSRPQSRSCRNPPSRSPAPNLEALQDRIEKERRRLTDAEAVLDCMIFAIEDDVRMQAPGPSYANVLRIVRAFVNTTIDQLDSVYVKAAITRVPHRTSQVVQSPIEEYAGVKDSAPAYAH